MFTNLINPRPSQQPALFSKIFNQMRDFSNSDRSKALQQSENVDTAFQGPELCVNVHLTTIYTTTLDRYHFDPYLMNDFAPRSIALMCTWNDRNLNVHLHLSMNTQLSIAQTLLKEKHWNSL